MTPMSLRSTFQADPARSRNLSNKQALGGGFNAMNNTMQGGFMNNSQFK